MEMDACNMASFRVVPESDGCAMQIRRAECGKGHAIVAVVSPLNVITMLNVIKPKEPTGCGDQIGYTAVL